MTLIDPTSGAVVVATADMKTSGSWCISISGYNFMYSRLKVDPRKFVGTVFMQKPELSESQNQEVKYVKVTNAVHEWVKGNKKTDLPFLEYHAVKFETIFDQFAAIEAIEAYREKVEGEFIEQKNDEDTPPEKCNISE